MELLKKSPIFRDVISFSTEKKNNNELKILEKQKSERKKITRLVFKFNDKNVAIVFGIFMTLKHWYYQQQNLSACVIGSDKTSESEKKTEKKKVVLSLLLSGKIAEIKLELITTIQKLTM